MLSRLAGSSLSKADGLQHLNVPPNISLQSLRINTTWPTVDEAVLLKQKGSFTMKLRDTSADTQTPAKRGRGRPPGAVDTKPRKRKGEKREVEVNQRTLLDLHAAMASGSDPSVPDPAAEDEELWQEVGHIEADDDPLSGDEAEILVQGAPDLGSVVNRVSGMWSVPAYVSP